MTDDGSRKTEVMVLCFWLNHKSKIIKGLLKGECEKLHSSVMFIALYKRGVIQDFKLK